MASKKPLIHTPADFAEGKPFTRKQEQRIADLVAPAFGRIDGIATKLYGEISEDIKSITRVIQDSHNQRFAAEEAQVGEVFGVIKKAVQQLIDHMHGRLVALEMHDHYQRYAARDDVRHDGHEGPPQFTPVACPSFRDMIESVAPAPAAPMVDPLDSGILHAGGKFHVALRTNQGLATRTFTTIEEAREFVATKRVEDPDGVAEAAVQLVPPKTG